MPLKVRDAASALTQKGFQELPNRDHRYFFFYVDQKKTSVRTKISHGETEISDLNCKKMAWDMKLTKKDFDDFMDCDLQMPGYLKKLVDSGHVKLPPAQQEQSRRSNS